MLAILGCVVTAENDQVPNSERMCSQPCLAPQWPQRQASLKIACVEQIVKSSASTSVHSAAERCRTHVGQCQRRRILGTRYSTGNQPVIRAFRFSMSMHTGSGGGEIFATHWSPCGQTGACTTTRKARTTCGARSGPPLAPAGFANSSANHDDCPLRHRMCNDCLVVTCQTDSLKGDTLMLTRISSLLLLLTVVTLSVPCFVGVTQGHWPGRKGRTVHRRGC